MERIYGSPLLQKLSLAAMAVIDIALVAGSLSGSHFLIIRKGAGMPLLLLAGTPFTSFLWPGIILLVVIGGSHLAAFTAIVTKSRHWAEYTAVAGFGLLIYLFTELYVIKSAQPLLAVYFALGIINLALLVYQLKVIDAYSDNS